MSLLWTSDAMIEAMNGRPVGKLPDGITGISIDTRTLRKGRRSLPSRAMRWTATIMRQQLLQLAQRFLLWRKQNCPRSVS